MIALCKIFPANLQILRLIGNEITRASMLEFSLDFPANLTYLELSNNQIEDMGLLMLEQVLIGSQLSDLCLIRSGLTSDGFMTLMNILSRNKKIRSLNSSENTHVHMWMPNIFNAMS